jgi:hypothetical protein
MVCIFAVITFGITFVMNIVIFAVTAVVVAVDSAVTRVLQWSTCNSRGTRIPSACHYNIGACLRE